MGDDGDMDSIIGGDTGIQAVPDKEQPTRSNVYPTTVYVYKYNNASWKDQLSAIETYTVNANGVVSLANTQNFTYDSMGNPTNYNGVSLTWQGKQLKSHTTTNGYMITVLQFSYDENGLRTEKGFLTDKTYYYYNGSVLIGMQRGNVTQRFSYDASGKVVSVDYSTNGGSSYTTYYYLRNAQGDIVKLIDNNRNTVVEYTYDSWGKILATTGSLANTVGTNQPFRYRGYVYDNETGWYYLQTRYYDPTTCRFISSDVYLSTGQGVLGHNSYAYCNNNPINMIDNYGTEGEALIETWGATMWWLVAVDGPLPFGEVIYVGGLVILGIALIFTATASVATIVEPIAEPLPQTKAKPKQNIRKEDKPKDWPDYPGNDPTKSPGKGWKWKGQNPKTPGEGPGNYTRPNTGDSLHPDLNHPKPIGPHWDYRDPTGNWWRLFPDGSFSPK